MFALSKIAVANTSTIHLKDANGGKLYDEAEKPVTITIYSPGSIEFEKGERWALGARRRPPQAPGQPTDVGRRNAR